MNKHVLIFLTLLVALTCCRRQSLPYPADGPHLSADTLLFDTVFTSKGSTTRQLKIYNPTASALTIKNIRLEQGTSFKVNVDGETSLERLSGYSLASQDSLFVFVKVFIDPQSSDSPVLVEDHLAIDTDAGQCVVTLQAYGQDVRILRDLHITSDSTLTAGKPYLVIRSLQVDSGCRLTIDKGAVFFMKDSAELIVRGELNAVGTIDEPIIMRGARLYHIYNKVPYDYISGLWGGVFLLHSESEKAPHHQLANVDIHGANVGLYCYAPAQQQLPSVSMMNCRIHNHAIYGLVLQNFDSHVVNTEISNCANYCVYLAGGTHSFTHNTIASYFNSSSVVLHSVGRENVSAMFINNLSKHNARTVVNLTNSIVSGLGKTNFTLATPMPELYIGTFRNCCLRTDSVGLSSYTDDLFLKANDTLFVNTYFNRQEELYYDFRLDSASVARGMALRDSALAYPTDRLGHPRLADDAPDAGCYEYTAE